MDFHSGSAFSARCVNESRYGRGKRGHGGVCLFNRSEIRKGVQILETDNAGFIWIKLCKDFFKLEMDICMCFVYIPPQDSVYYKSHNIGYFEQLERGIRKYSSLAKIIIIGGIKGRCGTRSVTIQDNYMFEKYISTIDNTDYTLPHSVFPETRRCSMDV